MEGESKGGKERGRREKVGRKMEELGGRRAGKRDDEVRGGEICIYFNENVCKNVYKKVFYNKRISDNKWWLLLVKGGHI